MKQSEAAEFWPLIKAWGEGKQLQFNAHTSPCEKNNHWVDVSDVSFSYLPRQYRIKPEPREFFLTVNRHEEVTSVHTREQEAENCAAGRLQWRVVKVREVLDYD